MKGRYKLVRQLGGFGYYAVVEVEVLSEPASGKPRLTITFADFDAGHASNHPVWRSAMAEGLEYAASRLGSEGLTVRVTDAKGMEVDTTFDCMKFAAAFALWDALKAKPADLPKLDPELKRITFPE